jgi:pimeloyl-ACP methyl ester carboxylesterase
MTSALPSSQLLFFKERGSGPPLLLVHGLMVTGEMFGPVIERFASRHRVIVPDLRGHGQSRQLPPPYTAAQLAADLAGLLDHLGIAACAVLGYSQGGAIAQQLAIDHPERCDRLVLACTYAFNMASPREKLEGHVVPVLIRVLGMRRFAKLVATAGIKQSANWLVPLIASQDRRLMLSAWKETMAFDSRDRLAEIRCPTLVIAGSKDVAVPIHHAKMLHDGVAGSQLVVIDGAGHDFLWSHSEEFVRVTDEFLTSSSGAGRLVSRQ